MSALSLRRRVIVMVAGMVSLLVAGCVVAPGGGYYDQGYGPGYYEPFGVVVGGWGGGYHVGPVRGGGGGFREAGGRAGPAGASHAMPSLPSGGRSGGGGGGRGGGSRGGGERSH